jgi:hypothetical protein
MDIRRFVLRACPGTSAVPNGIVGTRGLPKIFFKQEGWYDCSPEGFWQDRQLIVIGVDRAYAYRAHGVSSRVKQ